MTEAPIKLAGYFLEWQLIEDAKSELADRSKDLFKAMKDEGYDTKAARAVFREKRAELNAKPEDVAKAEEAEAIQDLYRAALDSGLTARAGRARETGETGMVPVTGRERPMLRPEAASTEARFESVSLHHSQSAETPTADKPEAHAQPLSASGAPFAGPQLSAVPGGEPSIPSSDDGGAKMDQPSRAETGQPDAMSESLYTQSERAAPLSDEDVPAFLKREVA